MQAVRASPTATPGNLEFDADLFSARTAMKNALAFSAHLKIAALTISIAAGLGVAFFAAGSDAPANIPLIAFPSTPLFGANLADKPAMALALSVEYPTVGALYTGGSTYGQDDATYKNTTEYLGYFDAESCYSYLDRPTESPAVGMSRADYKRFERIGPATQRMCTNAFSGNFLNWAAGSAVDMLRMALTGGDRYIDTAAQTILQRAVISHGEPVCSWNSDIFPAKTIKHSSAGASKPYWGAIPDSMVASANNSDIWVSNTLNRIYFGTSKGGSCGNTSTYRLGAGPIVQSREPTVAMPQPTALPADAQVCGYEGYTCDLGEGVKEVWFGVDTRWTFTLASGALRCDYTQIGDPASGVPKICYTRIPAGKWQTPPTIGPIVFKPKPTARPAGGTLCASEGGICNISGTMEVWYGSGTSWAVAPASGALTCSHLILSDVAPGSAKACYAHTYSGAWKPEQAPAAPNSDGFFYARVGVCGRDDSGNLTDIRDYGLCRQYPGGNYKPSGAIQKYANDLRLAAFSYLLDQSSSVSGGRYGGVLRAPMKYVGPKTFDIHGTENTADGGNPAAEWDPVTGVFRTNPDNDTSQANRISGVINYLNQFGRTGPRIGRYKAHDPVGELHYETLRYLQGLQPSAASIASTNAAMADGFPYATTWADPYGDGRSSKSDYSCVKSSIVTIGDIQTHDGNRLPAASAANNIPDINHWRSVVQAFEKNSSVVYFDAQGKSRSTGNPNTPNAGVPNNLAASQLMGTAYWSNTHDIRGSGWTEAPDKQRRGLRVKNYFFDVNSYGFSNDTSFRRNNNQFFLGAKYGSFETRPADASKPHNTYGNPFLGEDGKVNNDIWQEPSSPGESRNFYLQSSAREILRAFDMTLGNASAASRSIAGTAVSNKNFTQAGSTIFQGGFDTSDWSGDVYSLPVSVSTNLSITVGAKPNWSAATRLGALAAPAASRKILVGRAGASSTPAAVSFTWAQIDDALKVQLSKATASSTADGMGQDRLNYLRGDKSREGVFRKRNKLLGDVVNSSIAYSGTPSASLGSEPGYTLFRNNALSRAPAVFVGANDGMLHAFDARNGDELFAYIPSWMGPNLSALAHQSYVHRAYVDAPPVVAEARVGASTADWKTVLVSGTGAGGRGVFALDVTNPAAFSANSVMWEFTQADDPDMGFVVGRPQIVKMRTSEPGATPVYRWFAAVAGGVNNYVPDIVGNSSLTGRPALFLLALDKEPGTAWTSSGSTPNYYKVSLPIDPLLGSTVATGVVNFGIALGAAREVSYIYAGDLHGQLWKLDFSRQGAAGWRIETLSGFNKGSAASPVPVPLYTARTASGGAQPITMAPSLVAGPQLKGQSTVFVAFGTGKFMEASDKGGAQQNSLYVIYDNGSAKPDSDSPTGPIVSGRGRLAAGTMTPASGKVSVSSFVWGRAASDGDTTQRSGWYADFPTSGERQISNATVAGDYLVFGSTIPAVAGAGCAAGGGGGREYLVNIDTGSGTSQDSSVGLLGEPVLATVSEATTYTTSLTTGRRTQTVVQQVLQQGSDGVSTSSRVTSTFTTGRLSWRQINNYQDLKASP